MTIVAPPRTDQSIQDAVEDELEWTPDVDAAAIGVAVDAGTVSLSGEVPNYTDRLAAVRATLRVRGVSTVVDDLVVHTNVSSTVTEADIAKEVDHALAWAVNVPDSVKATIENHDVVLSGHVDWDYQRQAAKRAVQYLRGVYAVRNTIALKPRVSAADAEQRIRAAITRNALFDANTIVVTTNGTAVTLTGTVRSWAEKQQAGFTAWASPNVNSVDNHIQVTAL